MKVTVAIDSFKGSVSSKEAGEAVCAGILRADPDACVRVCQLADGGEGTVSAIVSAKGGRICRTEVTGPLGNVIEAEYGIIDTERTAVMEMSSASGITLVPAEHRDPYRTTTYGFGELIRHAVIQNGCRKFIIGIGGSATNDGGIGMLSALGFGMLDGEGKPVSHGAVGLSELKSILTETALPELSECEFHIACDVKNPLLGENGASYVFGPQKGASPDQVKAMDGWMTRYAELSAAAVGKDFSREPGAGAAGGVGFALFSFLGGKFEQGVELVIRETGLAELIADSDVVVTGEGRLDGQSVMGKAPVGVAREAKKHGKTVVAVAGCVSEDANRCNAHGIDAIFPILRAPISLAEAMKREVAEANLTATAEQIFRLIGKGN